MAKEKRHSFRGKVVSSAEKQKERGGSRYLTIPKGIKMFKLPEGVKSFQMDFLPYLVSSDRHAERNDASGVAIPGSEWYRASFKTHRNIGANNETVICPKSFGHKCPICEYQLKRIKDGADKEEFKVLYPQERSLYALIPVGHKDYPETIHVWDMSDFLFQETLIDTLKEDDSNEDFFTLDNGKTASVRLKWKEIGRNNFPEVVDIIFKDREPFEDSVLDDVPDLDNMLKVLSYDELEAKFFDVDSEKDAGKLTDTDDVEEEPAPRRRATKEEPPAKARRPVKEEEDEPEPAPRSRRAIKPEPEEEDEPEPAPRARKVSKPEPEEEDEPEPAPKRSSKKEEPAPKSGKEKCPHGHRFGVDTDTFDDCDKCEIWDDCIEQKEKS